MTRADAAAAAGLHAVWRIFQGLYAMSSAKTRASKSGTKSAAKRPSPKRTNSAKWSAKVMKQSDAMDLQAGVFKLKSARAVANSLKKSSEASHRRKSSPFRSAMSMLNFEINRGGKNLSKDRVRVLNQAKVELRKVFGRPAG
jgi:hypothetical protein